MGCDIHIVVERRNSAGEWERVFPPKEARDPWLVENAGKHPDGWYEKRAAVTWYGGRNYVLFGVLANVRNGYGFAGIATGNSVVPISEPRGFPQDMSEGVRALAEERGHEDDVWLGDHSHTWLTLDEVLAYDWGQEKMTIGVVPLAAFSERVREYGEHVPAKGAGSPYEDWSGGITGRGITTLTASEALDQLKRGGIAERPGWDRPDRHEVYVQDSWVTSLRERIGADWFNRVLPALQALDPDPRNVRLVFGFDS